MNLKKSNLKCLKHSNIKSLSIYFKPARPAGGLKIVNCKLSTSGGLVPAEGIGPSASRTATVRPARNAWYP